MNYTILRGEKFKEKRYISVCWAMVLLMMLLLSGTVLASSNKHIIQAKPTNGVEIFPQKKNRIVKTWAIAAQVYSHHRLYIENALLMHNNQVSN